MDDFLKIFIPLFVAFLAYVFGRVSKFKETQLSLLFEKYKKYDVILNSWYAIVSFLANPDFVARWNNGDSELFKMQYELWEKNYEKRREAGVLISGEMEVLNKYLDIKIRSILSDAKSGSRIPIVSPLDPLIEEIRRIQVSSATTRQSLP